MVTGQKVTHESAAANPGGTHTDFHDETPHWSLINMVLCLSSAIELVSGNVVKHNRNVALIAHLIAKELGLPGDSLRDCVLAGLLHDIGALSLKNRLDLFNFDEQNVAAHSELGYRHIGSFKPLGNVADIVRHHHARWVQRGEYAGAVGELSYLVHLADRISVLIDPEMEILGQSDRIKARIAGKSGDYFKPEHVDAFMELARRECFWFAVAGDTADGYFDDILKAHRVALDDADILDFSRMIGKVIDFRCPFTAIHSSRVAAVSAELACRTGLDGQDCRHMMIAGYLHDIGKLAVPAGIIEKPAELSWEEWNIIKSHPYHTARLLGGVENFDRITSWAASHHEKLNGNGYPFHYNEESLGTGERIMAVSDVFTALMEDRPYRRGLEAGEALEILDRMADQHDLDGGILATLKEYWPEMDRARIEAEEETAKDYADFISGIDFTGR